MPHVNLADRHWKFRDHPSAPIHTVTGKGVVGHFPVLKTTYSQPLPPQTQTQTQSLVAERQTGTASTASSSSASISSAPPPTPPSSSSTSSTSPWHWPFAYQSCTTSTSYPASMKGWLEFRVNDRDTPHRVHIPPEHLSIPGGGLFRRILIQVDTQTYS